MEIIIKLLVGLALVAILGYLTYEAIRFIFWVNKETKPLWVKTLNFVITIIAISFLQVIFHILIIPILRVSEL